MFQPKVRYSLTFQVSQYILVLLNQDSLEMNIKVTNEDPDPVVHALGI